MNDYTHYIVNVNNTIEAIPYTETIPSEFKEFIPVNMNHIPKLDVNSISTQSIERRRIYQSIFVKLWNQAATSLYIKQNWNDLDYIIFSKQRTEEDKMYLSQMLPIQWALGQTSSSYNRSDWEYLYKMLQD